MLKKVFLLCLVSLVLLTGCGKGGNEDKNNDKETNLSDTNKLTCSKKTEENGKERENITIITHEDGIVKKIEDINIIEMDESLIDETINAGNEYVKTMNTVKGFNAKYSKESDSKIKYSVIMDYEKLEYEDLKTIYGENYDENANYSFKNISLEEYVNNNLSDYDCK